MERKNVGLPREVLQAATSRSNNELQEVSRRHSTSPVGGRGKG